MLTLPLPPMEPMPEPRPESYDHPGWTAELKWDGVRNVALVEGGRVRLFTRRLRERTDQYPELQALAGQVAAGRAVLDGELVVLRGGRPSFNGILEREQVAGAVEIRRRAGRDPAVFMVFDLLEWDGEPWLSRPLHERQAALQAGLRPGGPAHPVDSFPAAASALFAAVDQQQLEGIVCKRLDSRYRPGPEKSPLWVKIKRRLDIICVVGGYTVTAGRVGALLIGAYHADGRLRYLGRAGSGLTEAQLEQVAAHLPPAACPFDPAPQIRAERFARIPDQVVWVAARLTVAIEFAEWTEDGRLRHPVVKGFTPQPPDQAVLP